MSHLECKDRIGLRDDRSEELLNANQVEIYPNPIKNNVLQISTSESCDYTIYNLSGQLVDEGSLEKGATRVELTTPSGIYFIIIHTDQGVRSYHKFIK